MKQFLLIVCLLTIISSNKNNSPDIVYLQWSIIIKVQGPSKGSINQPVTLKASWPYASGYDILDKFASSEGSFEIAAGGKKRYEPTSNNGEGCNPISVQIKNVSQTD